MPPGGGSLWIETGRNDARGAQPAQGPANKLLCRRLCTLMSTTYDRAWGADNRSGGMKYCGVVGAGMEGSRSLVLFFLIFLTGTLGTSKEIELLASLDVHILSKQADR